MNQNQLNQKAEYHIRQYYNKTADILLNLTQTSFKENDVNIGVQTYIATFDVKKKTGEINLRIDPESGELLSFIIPENYKDAAHTLITKNEALQITAGIIEIPADAEMNTFFQEKETDSHITNITYRHIVNGIEIENDGIGIQINSKTKKIISFSKNWNAVVEIADVLSFYELMVIAQNRAGDYTSSDDFDIEPIEKRYIPIIDVTQNKRKTVKYVKVQQILISEKNQELPKTIILSIDCVTGNIVRVEYSR